jgi:signal transduction histidine kinase
LAQADARPSLRPNTVALVLIAGGVGIAGFIAVSVISQSKAREIDHLAGRVADEIAPKIDDLTEARGQLHRASVLLRMAFETGASNAENADFAETERRLRSALHAYETLPATAGEPALRRDGTEAPAAYLRLGDRILDRLGKRDLAGAGVLAQQLAGRFDAADESLERLVQLNAEQARISGEQIRVARRHATALAYTLHGLAALLALLLTSMVVRAALASSRAADERLKLELERKQLAEERAAELDLFAARIAHDLKNPLAATILQLELAGELGEQPQRMKTRIAKAQKSVERTVVIIDEILALARAGGRSDPEARASLREVMEGVIGDCALDAARVGAKLEVAPFEDVELACAEGPLFSVIANLVRNAVKYIGHSHSSERWIDVRVAHRAGVVRVAVEDNGPGLPPQALAGIFEPFVRGPHFDEPGLGLGLATVRRIVVAHGGQVGVESREGQGSCFWFEIPVAEPLSPVVTH